MQLNSEKNKDEKHYALENQLIQQGFRNIAGFDEAGRGALAGPVVAAAVFFKTMPHELLYDIKDSKKISEKNREHLFDCLIQMDTMVYGIGIVDANQIDEMNILRASLHAMSLACEQLRVKPDLCLVDGKFTFPSQLPQYTLIQGDNRCLSIAAASIVAKVTRDRLMRDYAKQYPEYGFLQNKGYGTQLHRKKLLELGMTPVHRKSFRLRNKN